MFLMEMEEEEEEEALRNHCKRMISLVRRKQRLGPSEMEERRQRGRGEARGRKDIRPGSEGQDGAGDERRDHRLWRDRTSSRLNSGQGPEVQAVPAQIISLLKLKAFKEDMRRAAEVELHDPAVCAVCEQQRASLALRDFITRKKTQLQIQTLKGRLNTHLICGGDSGVGTCKCEHRGSLCKISQSPSMMPLTGFGRNICGSQQPGVALATTKERGVALATDEMRGYPDKNATGTHLARPRCPFSDR